MKEMGASTACAHFFHDPLQAIFFISVKNIIQHIAAEKEELEGK